MKKNKLYLLSNEFILLLSCRVPYCHIVESQRGYNNSILSAASTLVTDIGGVQKHIYIHEVLLSC